MFNCKIKYGDSSSEIYFPCRNNVLSAKFDELHIPEGDKPSAKIVVEEISYEPLKCLVSQEVDPDALNELAKKLESLSKDEVVKFGTVAETKGINDLYEFLNLTDNMHYYTLITDMRDMAKVGKLHMMTREGSVPIEILKDEKRNYTIGKELIESGTGVVTKNGILYTNDDLEYYRYSKPEMLPVIQSSEDEMICVMMRYQGNTNYVFLPDVKMAFQRAAHRMGAEDFSQCEYKIEYCDFHMDRYEEEREIKFNPDKLQECLENILNNEGVEKLNAAAYQIARLSKEKLAMLVPVIDYAKRYDSEAIIKLAECIDSFEVFGNVSTAYGLGITLINDNPYYELHEDIEDYFNFEKYGEDMDMQWDGKFLDGDIYVGICDGNTLENIFNGNEPEKDMDENFELSM